MSSLPKIPEVELLEELGRGAYSIVYRGLRKGVPCAVKLPRARARWTRWVYREAVALARVHHPCLPSVLEVGQCDDWPFMVMELVEGVTLSERLDRGPLGETDALEVARQLASALAVVHDAGLVHRDVKPRNIVIERSGRLRLVDFGFASPVERVAEGIENAGTPGYAAPEQFNAPSRVDGRADLYALGRVLEACLAARRDGSSGDQPLLQKGARSALRIAEGLTAESPQDRYPDARAALSEIDRALGHRELWGPKAYRPTPESGALIGREAEIQQLVRSWVGVGSTGGTTLLLRGRRGSGKSRLLSAFVAKARESGGRRILSGGCAEGDAPLSLLRRILEGYLDAVVRSPNGDREAGLARLRAAADGQLAAIANVIAPRLLPVLGGSTHVAVASGGFTEGAADLLLRLAREEGPLAVVVDDAQWADPASRAVLANLAHRAGSAPLLLVLGVRPDTDPFEEVATSHPGAIQTLYLSPFGQEQVYKLVAWQLGVDRVEPTLLHRILAMADETPMGALEVLGAFLDSGALRPREGSWIFDVETADRVVLPEGALALLGRRVSELPPATRAVLTSAAVLGSSFDDALLARVVGIDVADLWFAYADCTRAGLLQPDGEYRHRFVHDTLRENLLGTLAEEAARKLHQRVAEILDEGTAKSFETFCALATHYAAGDMNSPSRAYEAARTAATMALERFDNETALRYFALGRTASQRGQIALDVEFYLACGEARLRLGALPDAVSDFETGLQRVTDGLERATLLGRLAWAYATAADPDHAWSYLDRAFAALGLHMPSETVGSGARSLEALAGSKVREIVRRPTLLTGRERKRREILCQLHFQVFRLGAEYGRPLLLLQSAFAGVAASQALGPSRPQARARAVFGFALSVFGRSAAGGAEITAAHAMATELADPIAEGFCLQMKSVAASWVGDCDTALAALQECLDGYGPWLELNEYCYNAATAELVESLRGRSERAWTWIAKAVARLQRSQPASRAFAQYVVDRARTALASTGRSLDTEPWLKRQAESLAASGEKPTGFFRLISWGCRARLHLESGDAGPEFEALCAEFSAERHNPRFVHPTVAEYYIAVAHVRLHQCLRAAPSDRAAPVAALHKAYDDLRKAARMPLIKAHSVFIEGCLAWLDGSPDRMSKLFAKAAVIATNETCPWVLYGIARVRAHALREARRVDAARDHARVAETLAREHGSEPRLRWIREEFALPVPAVVARAASRSSLSSRRTGTVNFAKQQLAALLHVIRAPVADLRPEQQVPALVDDLVRSVGADRGLLSFQPDAPSGPRLAIGRTKEGADWSADEPWRAELVQEIRALGEPWPLVGEMAAVVVGPEVPPDVDASRILAVPLFLHERDVGVLMLERSAGSSPFAPDERELLLVLSYQAPVSIELARLVIERDQLHASLQQAQKMEAVGQLASSVAHDFANMLTAVKGSVSILERRIRGDREVTAELEIIAGAADRAGRLMRQLLSFSQRRPLVRTPTSINDIILDLAPMVERLVGEPVRPVWDLDPDVETVAIERASFEQVLVNLVLNAKDAMPTGGTLTIATRNVILDEAAVRRGARLAGPHVLVEVRDTGYGIPPDHLARVFDPFFTTKPAGTGTGIGLTTAYGFVKSSLGHIEVGSVPGKGATFRLYFPRADLNPAVDPNAIDGMDDALAPNPKRADDG